MSRELTDAEVKVLTELSYKKSIKKENKMSKELEALKIVRQSIVDMLDKGMSMDGYIATSLEEKLDIIETALKEWQLIKQTKIIVADKNVDNEDLEKLKNQRMFVGDLEQCEIKPLFDEETLKALEIIKRATYIFGVEGKEKTNCYNCKIKLKNLSQWDIELLKKVLL